MVLQTVWTNARAQLEAMEGQGGGNATPSSSSRAGGHSGPHNHEDISMGGGDDTTMDTMGDDGATRDTMEDDEGTGSFYHAEVSCKAFNW